MDASLPAHFAALPDPRANRGRNHPLLIVLTIALCAVVFGADSWVEIAQFGEAKQDGSPVFSTCPTAFSRMIPLAISLPPLTRSSSTPVFLPGCKR